MATSLEENFLKAKIEFTVSPEQLQLVDADGVPTTVPGTHILEVGLDGPQIQVRVQQFQAK
jgi:hypothetical protein